MNTDLLLTISMRHLKVILCLAESRNVTRAAHLLFRSRTAVSKALSDLEKQIGVIIFERSSSGYIATAEGEALISRAKIISDIFTRLSKTYQNSHKRPQNINTIPLFKMDIATKRLVQLALLADTENIEEAAKRANQTPSAIYKSVHDLEELLDLTLFARLPNRRIIPVGYGEILCQQVKLALSQLSHAIDDIKNIQGEHKGLLRIGSLPSMRTYVLPVALAKLAKIRPELSVQIDAGPYTHMAKDILSGDLDIIIGGTKSGSSTAGLKTEKLAQDRVCLVASAQHPLAQKNTISTEDLSNVNWVLPVSGTPSRDLFSKCLEKSGITINKSRIETGSVITLRGILMSSEAVTVGTMYQTHYEQKLGLLKILPFKLVEDDWPLGLTVREETPPPNSLKYFLTCLRETIQEIEDGQVLNGQDWTIEANV